MDEAQVESEVKKHCSQYQNLELRQACHEGAKAMGRHVIKKMEEDLQ